MVQDLVEKAHKSGRFFFAENVVTGSSRSPRTNRHLRWKYETDPLGLPPFRTCQEADFELRTGEAERGNFLRQPKSRLATTEQHHSLPYLKLTCDQYPARSSRTQETGQVATRNNAAPGQPFFRERSVTSNGFVFLCDSINASAVCFVSAKESSSDCVIPKA